MAVPVVPISGPAIHPPQVGADDMASRQLQAAGKTYATQVKSSDLIGGIIGGIGGYLSGGLEGAARGFTEGYGGGGGRAPATGSGGCPPGTMLTPIPGGQGFGCAPITSSNGSSPCPPGYTRIGNTCINPAAGAPGGAPLTVPTSGTTVSGGGGAVMGSFGLPARQPQVRTTSVRLCGRGMVLGADNLCYPKAVLGRRSKFRKWRQPPRPALSSSDVRTIRKADRLVDRVKRLNKDLGLKVPAKKRK